MARAKGTLSCWHADKGYGFITPMLGGEPIFIHISDFAVRDTQASLNSVITYDVGHDKRGRVCARKATISGQRIKPHANKGEAMTRFSIWLACGFFVLLAVSWQMFNLPFVIVTAYGAMSVLTFIAYAIDKSAAKKAHARRTPENTLHLFALAGGWPGALVAQQLLRHKTQKQSFRFVFWLTVIINAAALGYVMFSPNTQALLASLGMVA